jgi:DNA topoisomerase-1
MAGNLVIVESPGKTKIQGYLGKDFTVKASLGHIRDLQENKLSVDIEHGFKPEYVIPAEKKKVVAELKKLVAQADTVWLASDPDREGEAIAWHLYETLGLKDKDTHRITFHEITPEAVKEAVKNPREIDMNLVNAQQARRVLDRLVGFELSPVLWKKVQPKLSAGRVQSVALRLVVDREKEIMAFKPEASYRIDAIFHPEGAPSAVKVKATLDKKFAGIEDARKVLSDNASATFTVAGIEKKDGERLPAPPFTTSTLQQEAARKLRFPVNLTMRVAQSLYEKGLITYMRTDSVNLSKLALGTAKKYITENYGENYSSPRQFRTKSKGAQEAHEAIRPTFIEHTTISGTAQEQKLYELIWKRTVASQMASAKTSVTTVRISSSARPEKFMARGTQIVFDGFLKVYMEGRDDAQPSDDAEVILPELAEGQKLECREMDADCKFTQPPFRYSESSLVKKLEELGIGRPATYAQIITTLTTARGYVYKGSKPGTQIPVKDLVMKKGEISEVSKTETVGAESGKLIPNEIGMIVSDYLLQNFSDIMDYNFTANVETDFDEIAEGKKQWNAVIGEFYGPFHKKVEEVISDKKYNHVEKNLGNDPADGQPIIAKFGKYGPFVQKGQGDNVKYANLGPGQLIETLTLEDACKLFMLPRTVGQYNGTDVIATKGRFGPYVKYGSLNASLPKGTDPLEVTLEECIKAIEKAQSKTSGNDVIADFKDIDAQIISGRYGPYIKHAGSNYKIPKGTDASKMTEADCKSLIESTAPTKHRRGSASGGKGGTFKKKG